MVVFSGEYLGPRRMRMGSGEDSAMRNFIVLGRPRRRWEGYIRMELEEIGINAGN